MRHAITSVLICSLCTGTAAISATSDIDLMTKTDDLGYTCLDEALFEETADSPALAFLVGGKLRLPRICVDDPCQASLTQDELSQLTGTDPRIPRFAREWNDYYARYADYCRKETTPDGGAVAESPQDFWERTRRPAQIARVVASGSPVLPPINTQRSSPVSFNGITPIGSTLPVATINNFPSPNLFDALSSEGGGEETVQIGSPDSGEVLSSSETMGTAIVPIHGTLLFMLTSLMAIAGLRRFRR